MKRPAFLLLAATVALAGCGGHRYCLKPQPYQSAGSVPPLTAVEGLTLPESAAALKVPELRTAAVPFGQRAENGDGVCLDRPPSMASPAPATPAS